jgi:uncharacterized protein YecE (DUF72 family)
MYYRLHGSPDMYYSSYDAAYLERLAERMRLVRRVPVWCIFDNTARGAATLNAMDLVALLSPSRS